MGFDLGRRDLSGRFINRESRFCGFDWIKFTNGFLPDDIGIIGIKWVAIISWDRGFVWSCGIVFVGWDECEAACEPVNFFCVSRFR